MGKKFKPKKFGIFIIVIFTVGSFLVFGAIQDKAFSFEIPTDELSVVPNFQGNVPNQQIFCLVKQTTGIIDNEGNQIGSEESAFLGRNPVTTYSFIDTATETEIDNGEFIIVSKIKCLSSGSPLPQETTDETDFGLLSFPSVDIPFTIKKSDLIVKVYSRDSEDKLIETYNAKLTTKQKKITSPNEVLFGAHTIQIKDVLKFIDDGSYSSWQHITLEGKIKMFWDAVPSVVYEIELGVDEQFDSSGNLIRVDGDVITFRQIQVDKNTGDEEISKTGSDCRDDQIFVSGFCVTQSPSSSGNISSITPSDEFVSRFSLCLQTVGLGCMLTSEFIVVPLALTGILILIGGVAQKSKPDIYGVPNNF